MAAAFFLAGRLRRIDAAVVCVLSSALCFLTETPAKAAAGVISAAAIFFLPPPGRILNFFGNISYSFYLIHVTIGVGIIAILERRHLSGPGKLAAIALAFAASTFAAWLLWRFVEEPSRRWSSRLSVKPKPASNPTAQ